MSSLVPCGWGRSSPLWFGSFLLFSAFYFQLCFGLGAFSPQISFAVWALFARAPPHKCYGALFSRPFLAARASPLLLYHFASYRYLRVATPRQPQRSSVAPAHRSEVLWPSMTSSVDWSCVWELYWARHAEHHQPRRACAAGAGRPHPQISKSQLGDANAPSWRRPARFRVCFFISAFISDISSPPPSFASVFPFRPLVPSHAPPVAIAGQPRFPLLPLPSCPCVAWRPPAVSNLPCVRSSTQEAS